MKQKIIMFMFLSIIIVGCSNSNVDNDASSDGENTQESEMEKGKVYDVNEKVEITNSEKGFTYEITVNNVEVTENYNDQSIKEYTGIDKLKSGKFAILNVTVKNTSEQPINFKDQINPLFGKEGLEQGVLSNYKENINKDVKPGEETSIDLLYLWNDYKSDVKYYLTFEQYTENEKSILIPYSD